MSQQLPNLAELSHAEKDDLILRLFDELKRFQILVQSFVVQHTSLARVDLFSRARSTGLDRKVVKLLLEAKDIRLFPRCRGG